MGRASLNTHGPRRVARSQFLIISSCCAARHRPWTADNGGTGRISLNRTSLQRVVLGAAALLATVAAACGASDAPAATSTAPVPSPAAQPTRPVPPRLSPASAPTPGPLRPFTLPRAGGGGLSLSKDGELALADYLGKKPVSVVFYRGFF